jgi:hypothetical protein
MRAGARRDGMVDAPAWRRHALPAAGWALAAWSIAYLLPHLYWGLGGEAGLSIVKPSARELAQWQEINLVASGVLVLPALIGLGLVRHPSRRRMATSLRLASWAGAAIAGGHGLFGIAYRALNLMGAIDLDGDSRRFAVWDLVLFEPWFLIEGVLFVAVGWASLSAPGAQRRWLLGCAAGVLVSIATAAARVRVG